MKRDLILESVAMDQIEFGYEAQAATLFNQASCELPKGHVVRLCGPAGAGKSALLKLMAGLMLPQAGGVRLNGQDISQMSFEEFLPYRLQIGYGFDLGGLLNNKTLRENLALPLEYHKRFEVAEIHQRVESMLTLFNLQTQGHKRPSSVAGSQRKATCVARALIMSPQFLILDDPTTGLNNLAKTALIEWIRTEIKTGGLRFVLISSEDAEWCEKLGVVDLEVRNEKLFWMNNHEQARAA